MSALLTPDRARAALAPLDLRTGLQLTGLALLAAALFWSPLLAGGALTGGDWATHHYHYFDWVRISLTRHATLPLYMADAWVTPNFLGNAEAPTLGPLAWLLVLLPAGAYVKLLIVVGTAAGLGGCWLLLRDLEVAPPVAALGAVVYSWGGFFVSHVTVGHHWAMGAWLLPLLFWLYRRGALGSDGALVAAAALNAFTIMGGQHQPFIWQNLTLGAFALLWALGARAAFPLSSLAVLWVLSAGLGAVKLLPVFLEFQDYAPSARTVGFPLASLLPALAAPGRLREFVDPAIAYEFGSGWWEWAFYVGPLALAALAVGCVARARATWPLLAVGGFFLVISLEPLGVWPLLQDLPVLRSQRCPSRFLLLAVFALSIGGAVGLERLRRAAALRAPRAALVGAWLLAAAVGLDLWRESVPWQSAGVGEEIEQRHHRPHPELRETTRARIALGDFTPNTMVYRVDAAAPVTVALPVRFGKRLAEWEVDGFGVQAQGQLLAVEVPGGVSEVRIAYRPPGLRVGLAVSLVSALAAAGWLVFARSRETP
jgi:hypothetical protein